MKTEKEVKEHFKNVVAVKCSIGKNHYILDLTQEIVIDKVSVTILKQKNLLKEGTSSCYLWIKDFGYSQIITYEKIKVIDEIEMIKNNLKTAKYFFRKYIFATHVLGREMLKTDLTIAQHKGRFIAKLDRDTLWNQKLRLVILKKQLTNK
jgi:hypothetical protein